MTENQWQQFRFVRLKQGKRQQQKRKIKEGHPQQGTPLKKVKTGIL